MKRTVSLFLEPLLGLARVSRGPLSIDYDEGADVLYISFGHPQAATDTVGVETDALVRMRGQKVIGITVMNASKYPRVSVELPEVPRRKQRVGAGEAA
jgi:uncharacterized protein YuzE